MPPHRPRVLSAFLGKLTRNLSLNRYKHHIAEKRGGGEAPAVLDEIAELVSDTDNVERAVDRRELVRAIDTFLERLPADKRRIFVCRYWYFDPVSKIASRFGMTENHVSVTLNRLRFSALGFAPASFTKFSLMSPRTSQNSSLFTGQSPFPHAVSTSSL